MLASFTSMQFEPHPSRCKYPHLITHKSAEWDEDFLSDSDADGPFPNPLQADPQGLGAGMTIAFAPEKTTEVGY